MLKLLFAPKNWFIALARVVLARLCKPGGVMVKYAGLEQLATTVITNRHTGTAKHSQPVVKNLDGPTAQYARSELHVTHAKTDTATGGARRLQHAASRRNGRMELPAWRARHATSVYTKLPFGMGHSHFAVEGSHAGEGVRHVSLLRVSRAAMDPTARGTNLVLARASDWLFDLPWFLK